MVYIPEECPAVLTTAVQPAIETKKKEDLSSVLFFYVVLEVKRLQQFLSSFLCGDASIINTFAHFPESFQVLLPHFLQELLICL